MGEAALDAAVQAVRLRFPRYPITKRGPSLYEVAGRLVQLQLAPGHRGFLEPFVVDGPLKQPLGDYISGSSRNEAWIEPPMVQSALHALPRRHRVSFQELYPADRREAMLLAVMEADARESHAKQQLSRSPSPTKRGHRSTSNPPVPAPANVAGTEGISSPCSPTPSKPSQACRAPVPSVIRGLPKHIATIARGRVSETRSVSPQRRVPISPMNARRPPVVVFGTAPRSQSPARATKALEEVVLPPALTPLPTQSAQLRPAVSHAEAQPEASAKPEPQRLLSLKELQEAFSTLQGEVKTLQHELQTIRARAGGDARPGAVQLEAPEDPVEQSQQSDDIAGAETDSSDGAPTERSSRDLQRNWSAWSRVHRT